MGLMDWLRRSEPVPHVVYTPDPRHEALVPVPDVFTAPDLLGRDYPPAHLLVSPIIPTGFTLLAGAPKLGKSWLALALSIAVARGDAALGVFPCEPADALYLALEDTGPRLQGRLRTLLGRRRAPERLSFGIAWPRFTDGLRPLERWMTEHPGGLVVVDTWAKVRPRITSLTYLGDYSAVEAVKDIADDCGCGIVMVHHTTKADNPDKLATVMGTQGLAGAADAILVLSRGRGEEGADLYVTGRDVDEATYSMNFDGGTWTAAT